MKWYLMRGTRWKTRRNTWSIFAGATNFGRHDMQPDGLPKDCWLRGANDDYHQQAVLRDYERRLTVEDRELLYVACIEGGEDPMEHCAKRP